MAKVRCPCGRQYAIADEHVGQPVKCRACGRSFVPQAAAAPPPKAAPPQPTPQAPPRHARPPQTPPPGARRRIGDLAVARGFVSPRQLAECVEYQRALRQGPSTDERRLGQILLERQLINRAQLDRLVEEQQARPVREAAPPSPRAAARAGARAHPITEAQRETLRRSVAAAARRQAAREEGLREPFLTASLDRLRLGHFVLAGVALVGAYVVWRLWPPPEAQQTLVAFLESCGEDSIAPDRDLAARDFGLEVRSFDDVSLGSATTHDYATELQAFASQQDGKTWADLLAEAQMPDQKRQALAMAAPAFPNGLGPRSLQALTITVRPATLSLQWKPRGTGLFRESRYRFYMVKIETNRWSSDWKVAGYEDIGPAGSS